jgi:hypothetical protein
VQLTAANTDAQVDRLNDVLGEVAGRFQLRTGPLSAGDLPDI